MQNRLISPINITLFSLLWINFIQFPDTISVDMDPSWIQILAYAFQNQWQIGIDYVWTHASLGYFSKAQSTFNADLFYLYMTWWIIISAWFSITFLLFSQKLKIPEKILYFAILIIMISPATGDIDAWYFSFIVTSALLLFQPVRSISTPNAFKSFYLITIAFYALIAFTKFSYFILELIVITLLFIHFYKKYNYQAALFHFVYFIAIFILIWLSLGQGMNLNDFILQSIFITKGYSEAMFGSRPEQTAEIYLALIMIILLLLVWRVEFKNENKLEKILSIIVMMATILLLWKTGFTRHNIHSIIFFNGLALMSLLTTARYNVTRLMSGFIVILAIVGHIHTIQSFQYPLTYIISHWYQHLQQNLAALPQLEAFKQLEQLEVNRIKQDVDLPKMRKLIQQKSVDMLHPQQGIVLLNQFNYQPRPIFQGYSAYSAPLLQKNLHFYQNPQTAPQFVLAKLHPIDSRFPTLDDSLVLQQLLWHYDFKLEEKHILLLERKEKIKQYQDDILLKKDIEWQKIIDLSSWQHINSNLHLDIQLSHWGKIQSVIYHPPTVILEFRTENGKLRAFRLIPNMARTGFAFNPFLLTTENMKIWYQNPQNLPRITHIRVTVLNDADLISFQPTIKLKLTQFVAK